MTAAHLATPATPSYLHALAEYLESRAQAADAEEAARLNGVAARLRRRAASVPVGNG